MANDLGPQPFEDALHTGLHIRVQQLTHPAYRVTSVEKGNTPDCAQSRSELPIRNFRVTHGHVLGTYRVVATDCRSRLRAPSIAELGNGLPHQRGVFCASTRQSSFWA